MRRLLLMALLLAGSARAATPWDACFAQAGQYYGIHPALLEAIARHESGLNPRAIGRNTNGSVDIGLMQINTQHLPVLARVGITREHLLDPCTNIAVGAWVLANAVRRHGMTWEAIGAYNSSIPERRRWYAGKVAVQLMRVLREEERRNG